MFRKVFLTGIVAGLLQLTPLSAAEIVVRVAPPRAIVERRGPPPGRGYIWTPGYHRWDGHRHVWVPGAWVLPPRARAHWVPAHWVRRHHEYVFVEGHWR